MMRVISPFRFGIFIATTTTLIYGLIGFAIKPTVATVLEDQITQAYQDNLGEFQELKNDSMLPLKNISGHFSEVYTVTAYCSCEKCCGEWSDGFTYSGELAVEGVTIAADLSKLPLGTAVEIEGIGQRIVQDIGGAIDGNEIDLYFWNHADALSFGVQQLEVTILD